jgi:hypothetical protein
VAQKVLTSLQGTSTGGQATTEFTQLYQQKFNSTPVELADYGYDAMNVLALAGQVDAARVLATKKPSALPGITAWLSSNSV